MKMDWDSALKTADEALDLNKNDARVMIVKGEALFNICQFEHALVFFCRALVINALNFEVRFLAILVLDHNSFKKISSNPKIGIFSG